MNIEHLRAFHRIAETGNFTQVARELFLTQPAISMQIQSLEQNLGVVLFDRSRRRVSLTSEGQVLYRYTQTIFGVLAEVHEAFQELSSLQTGELLLGATSIMGAYYLPFFVNAFHRRHPGIKIKLVISNSHNIAGMLHSGELELGFAGSSSAHPNLSQHFLHREPLIMVAGKSSPLAERRATLTAQDIISETFIMREPGARMTNKVTQWLKKHAAGAPAPVLVTVDNMEVTKRMVVGGVGITALPRHAAQTELDAGALVDLHLEDFDMHVNYFLVNTPGRKLSRVTQSFLALLFEHGVPIPEELLPMGAPGSGEAS